MISPSDREKEEKILSKPSKKKKGRWTKNDTELTVMALPTTIWYILFCFLPMFGLIIAFKNYKITGGKSFIYNLLHSDWAGFKNFSFLIRSNDLFVILRNTILYNLAFIVLGMVFSVGLAIMISLLHNKSVEGISDDDVLPIFHVMGCSFLLPGCIPEPGQRSNQQYNEKCRQGTDSVVHECRCMAIYPDLHVSVEIYRIQHGYLPVQHFRY